MDKKITENLEILVNSMDYLIESKHKDFAENIINALKNKDKNAYHQAARVFNSAFNAFNACVAYESFKINQFTEIVNAEVQKLGWNEQPQQAQPEVIKPEVIKPEAKPTKTKAKKKSKQISKGERIIWN